MELLIFFAIPLATILLAIVLEKILNNPVLVGITFFAIYLILAFVLEALGTISDLGTALVAVIVYALIAFITAYLVEIIRCLLRRYCKCINRNNNCCPNNEINSDLINIGDNLDNIEESDTNSGENNNITLTGNIIPNQVNGGRTGAIRGRYRRY